MAKKNKNTKDKIKKVGTYLSIAALVLLIGSLFFIFGSRSSGNHNIEFNIETPEKVRKGVPIELGVNINNQTNEALSNSELTVRLDSGLVNLDFEGDKSVSRMSLNTIGEGTLTKEKVRVLPVGSIGSEHEIVGTLDYSIGSASFEKKFSKKITIEEKPIEISIEKPEQILGGSSFMTTVKYKNNTDFDFPSLQLQLDYPTDFNFISASLEPTSLNNQWNLGALKSGSEGSIDIRGTIENGGNEEINMKAVVLAEFLDQAYEIASTQTNVAPSESPLDVDVVSIGSPRPGNTLNYKIDYENKSGVALRNVTVSSELAGEMLDVNTISSDGEINRLGNQIVWDSDTNDELSVLEPSEKGTLSFKINLKENYPIRRLSDKNFELVVNTEIESPTVPYYIDADKTSASEETTTKVEGKTTVDAKGFYRDADSGFLNEGDLPPTIGEKTQFTAHWVIKNYATDVKDVKISSKLPEGVEWTGQVSSNIDSTPLYNEDEKTVTWEIDEISATRGVISRPIEAIFQIELLPQPEFEGSLHPLLLETKLEASDTFTKKTITHSSGTLNTSLSDDPTTDASDGVVR